MTQNPQPMSLEEFASNSTPTQKNFGGLHLPPLHKFAINIASPDSSPLLYVEIRERNPDLYIETKSIKDNSEPSKLKSLFLMSQMFMPLREELYKEYVIECEQGHSNYNMRLF